MSQPSNTIRIRGRMPLLVVVLVALIGGAVSPWADDVISHAVRFRTALSDSAQPPASPRPLLFAGVPPLA